MTGPDDVAGDLFMFVDPAPRRRGSWLFRFGVVGRVLELLKRILD